MVQASEVFSSISAAPSTASAMSPLTSWFRGINQAWQCFVKYGRPIYDHSYIAPAKNIRFLRAKVIEIMPQGCVT